jgi:hypothetical protein
MVTCRWPYVQHTVCMARQEYLFVASCRKHVQSMLQLNHAISTLPIFSGHVYRLSSLSVPCPMDACFLILLRYWYIISSFLDYATSHLSSGTVLLYICISVRNGRICESELFTNWATTDAPAPSSVYQPLITYVPTSNDHSSRYSIQADNLSSSPLITITKGR